MSASVLIKKIIVINKYNFYFTKSYKHPKSTTVDINPTMLFVSKKGFSKSRKPRQIAQKVRGEIKHFFNEIFDRYLYVLNKFAPIDSLLQLF